MCVSCTLGGSSRAAYPVFLLLGITLAYLAARYRSLAVQYDTKTAPHISSRDISFCTAAAAAGIIIGARIGYILLHWSYYSPNPVSVFFLWEGGFIFHGGLAGGTAAAGICSRIRGINWLDLMDLSAAPVSLGYGIGRIGCFFNGCCAGIPTELPWGMVFPILGPAARHPAQLYASGAGILLFFILDAIYRRTRLSSVTFSWFLILHGTYRIAVEQIRTEPPIFFFLTHGELFSIVMIISGLLLLRRALYSDQR